MGAITLVAELLIRLSLTMLLGGAKNALTCEMKWGSVSVEPLCWLVGSFCSGGRL